MAATHGEYRGYLRNAADMEAGQHRFHPVQSSETTYRPLLFGTLAVMGLLQVASSVAILLHLTGYLQEVGWPLAARGARLWRTLASPPRSSGSACEYLFCRFDPRFSNRANGRVSDGPNPFAQVYSAAKRQINQVLISGYVGRKEAKKKKKKTAIAAV